ncbi:hypothetical protein O1D23_000865 [Vibrio cholerae]|nr:hypothetical protein [Vibrio cholerae]
MSDNDYYNRTKEFDPRTRANGLDIEFELDAISAAFDKIPAPREDGQGYDGPIHVGEATAPTHAVQLQQMEAKLGDNTENANRAEEAAERAEEARDIAIEKARQSGEARDEALEAAATVTNIHREQLEKALGMNARVYPRLTNQNLKVGDVIPAPEDTADGLPITHVIVDGNAYAMSPVASGFVSELSYSSGTIGGTSVRFSSGYLIANPNATQADIERMISDGVHNRCVIDFLQKIPILNLVTANRSEIIGFGEDTELFLSSPGTAISMKSATPSTDALSNVTLKDFALNMKGLPNSIGIDMVYASVQSMLDGIKIVEIGENSIGSRISKEWYATTKRCSIRSISNSNNSIGVLVSTEDGQVNDIPIDFQINNVHTACVVDTTHNYVYKLVLTDTFHAENCARGLYVKSGYGVRQAVIRGYFENNSEFDVRWGDPIAGANDITQNVLWQSVSFNPNHSKVILYEGNHVFDCCDRIDTLEVHRSAVVEIRGGIVSNIVNTTGNPRAVTYRPTLEAVVSNSKYARANLLPAKANFYSTTTSANSVEFDWVSETLGTKPASGRTARVAAYSRRTYENAPWFYEFVVAQNATGDWGFTMINKTSNTGATVAVDSSTGVITIGDSRSDTKVYDLAVTPM